MAIMSGRFIGAFTLTSGIVVLSGGCLTAPTASRSGWQTIVSQSFSIPAGKYRKFGVDMFNGGELRVEFKVEDGSRVDLYVATEAHEQAEQVRNEYPSSPGIDCI